MAAFVKRRTGGFNPPAIRTPQSTLDLHVLRLDGNDDWVLAFEGVPGCNYQVLRGFAPSKPTLRQW
jgi:hypothetical protein